MLEFGFENLQWNHVVERAGKSIGTLEAVVGALRARAAAESKYAKTLNEGTDTSGGLFSGLLGRSRAEDDGRGPHDSLAAAIAAYRASVAQDATHRAAFASALEGTAAELSTCRDRHMLEFKRQTARADNLIGQVRVAGARVSKANAKLEERRRQHTAIAERARVETAAAALPPGADKETEHERRKRRTRVEAAATEVTEAESALRDCAGELVGARQARDAGLAEVARAIQVAEEIRLAQISRGLRLAVEADGAILSRTASEHARAAEAVAVVDVASDLRLFVHRCRVRHLLVSSYESALKQFEHAHARWREECNRSPSGFVVVSAIPATGGRIITDDDDEGGRVVPVAASVSLRASTTSEHIRKEVELGPVVERWVDDIFAGGGSETPFSIDWAGSAGDPAVGCSAEGDTAAAPPTADAAALVEAPMVEVEAVFDCLAGRTAFLRCLNVWRGRRQDVGRQFGRLAGVMWRFLDACLVHDDVDGGKRMMIMSETFYREVATSGAAARAAMATEARPMTPETRSVGSANDWTVVGGGGASTGDRQREFLQPLLRGHPIWRNHHFWEEAFYRSVREEVAKIYASHVEGSLRARRESSAAKPAASDAAGAADALALATSPVPPDDRASATSPTGDAPRSKSAPAVPPPREPKFEDFYPRVLAPRSDEYQQILFGQLGSYAMNMRCFGMPRADERRVVRRLAEGNGLPEEMLQMLIQNADTRASD